MSLITRQQKGSKLTIEEMDGNLEYLQSLSATTVLTEYPETTPELAGTRFWYKGNEWHYMTQAEIDSTEWTGLVQVGFPAPVDKSVNLNIYRPTEEAYIKTTLANSFVGPGYQNLYGNVEVDFVGLGKALKTINSLTFGFSIGAGNTLIKIRNAQFLINLEDLGTTSAFNPGTEMSSEVINDFFTQLPSTNKTVTLNVSGTTGAATCDPSIATAKGYTVITS